MIFQSSNSIRNTANLRQFLLHYMVEHWGHFLRMSQLKQLYLCSSGKVRISSRYPKHVYLVVILARRLPQR